LFTISVLFLLQVGNRIPVPGIDSGVLAAIHQTSTGGTQDIFGLLNQFTGGAFRQLAVFAMGIMPYITVSIILQLLTLVSPTLEKLSKEGEEGRKKIEQWTRYGTVAITFMQASMLLSYYKDLQGPGGTPVAYNPGLSFLLLGAMAMTGGTVLIMWMGEQISQRGVGNGISLIICANIIAGYPDSVAKVGSLVRLGAISELVVLAMVIMMIVVIAFVVLLTYGQRRVAIKRGKQVVGRRQSPTTSSYLPLRINTAGVIPVIFASSLMIFPSTLLGLVGNYLPDGPQIWLDGVLSVYWVPGAFVYVFFEFILIVLFCYFYTAITFNPQDIAENLQKQGVAIPGYQHGKKTVNYLEHILNRITLAGALMLAMVAILPQLFISATKLPPQVSDFLGGTSLIIVVGVALDTVNQIENHLRVRNYEGFRVGPSRRPRF